ncbi:MAG: type II toxin-antitoxin system VapC family toxin [Candidatus Methanosuratincola sp.]
MAQRRSSEKIYIDVNALYYFLTAHDEFGLKAKQHIEDRSGALATSVFSVWLLHVLTNLENIYEILEELEVDLLPLTKETFALAKVLDKPGDYEDRIHLSTMLQHGIKTIISNDRDFDGIPEVKRIF